MPDKSLSVLRAFVFPSAFISTANISLPIMDEAAQDGTRQILSPGSWNHH